MCYLILYTLHGLAEEVLILNGSAILPLAVKTRGLWNVLLLNSFLSGKQSCSLAEQYAVGFGKSSPLKRLEDRQNHMNSSSPQEVDKFPFFFNLQTTSVDRQNLM